MALQYPNLEEAPRTLIYTGDFGRRLELYKNPCDGSLEIELWQHAVSGVADAPDEPTTIQVTHATLRSIAAAFIRYADKAEAEGAELGRHW